MLARTVLSIPQRFNLKCYVTGASSKLYSTVSGITKAPISNKVKATRAPAKIRSEIGQPTGLSHPHLVAANELCQGITTSELADRRHRLMQSIQMYSMNLDINLKRHVVVIPAANKRYMSDKIPYVFRQNSDFYYFSGCLEPDSILLLHLSENSPVKSVLFMRPKDKHSELWDGVRTGSENAVPYFGVDESYSTQDFNQYLSELMSKGPKYTLWYDKSSPEQPEVAEIVQKNVPSALHQTVETPVPFYHKLRVFKSDAELELMRRTCGIASSAINDTIRESQPGDSEHLLFAKVDYYCRKQNAKQLAYPPVVASGENATTIHYIENNQVTQDGDLVLMDAGCEYGGYSSDITRTWPINGRFTDAQQVLYEITLRVQAELIQTLTKEGGQTLDDLFDTMCTKLGCYLQEIGLVDKSLKGLPLARAAYSFCPHHVSHFLGLDVHDTPTYSRSNPLTKRMVFTVEPGIYINHNRMNVPEEFRGLGIRIEDDCAILPDGTIEVLTRHCGKQVIDVTR